jgi:Flp pilus assembly protein TadD
MMGHCYQQLNDPNEAIRAYSTVVSIDESQGEAWANLASVFALIGKKAEAYSTLEQAVKHCENNWKIWHNLLFVSFSNK